MNTKAISQLFERRRELESATAIFEKRDANSATAAGYRLQLDDVDRELRAAFPNGDGVFRAQLAMSAVDGPISVVPRFEQRALGAAARVLTDQVNIGQFFASALMATVPLLEVGAVTVSVGGGEVPYSYLKSMASTTAILADGSTLTAAAPVYGGAVSSTLFKYSYLEGVSNELMRDTYSDIEAQFAGRIADQARASLGVDLWAGAGSTSAPEGLQAGVTSGVTAASATVLAVDDVANALSNLSDQYVNENTAILVSPDAFWDLARQTLGTSAAGGQAWDVSAGHGTLFGFRIRREANLAATATGNVVGIVGDFVAGYWVRLTPIEVASSGMGVGWDKDQTQVRVVLRADGRRLNAANSLRKITMA